MKLMRNAAGIAALFAFTVAGELCAGTMLGGLTVALSPDGKTLVAGGDNRVLYVMDPESLQVRDRIPTGTTMVRLSFNHDGSFLLVEDSAETNYFFATSDWKQKREIAKRKSIVPARAQDLYACVTKGDAGEPQVTVASLSDGSEKKRFPFPKDIRIAAVGWKPDGSGLAMITEGKAEPAEEKQKTPSNLTGIERLTFSQQHDGRASVLYWIDLDSGNKKELPLFYVTGMNSELIFLQDDVLVINYQNQNARISPSGEIKLFQSGGINHGIGYTPDQTMIFTGGLGEVRVAKASVLEPAQVSLSRLPGWSEYMKAFAANNEGPVFGATSGYRIIMFSRDAKLLKEAPVY